MISDAVKTAAIGGAVAVVVALITAMAQTKSTLADEKPRFIEEARVGLSITGVPVGTVVASMLAPKEFAKLVGDETNFDTRVAQWVPADGRSVAGSKYASAATSTAPDVRGVFVRGLNYSETDRNRASTEPAWADTDPSRQPGSLQVDSMKEHAVMFPGRHQVMTGNTGFWTLSPQVYNGAAGIPVAGEKESRPKNIALFHYIKIN
jgi:hypothetical protein